MNSFTFFAVFAFATLFVLPGCDEERRKDDRPPGVYGTIRSSGGEAVNDVAVHYIFYTQTNPVVRSVWISYLLATSQTVTVRIFDPFHRHIVTLIDSVQQPAGYHLTYFDTPVSNGIYSYSVHIGDSSHAGSFYIRNDDVDTLLQRSPLLFSDHEGHFHLSTSVLGIGRNISGEVVSDSITIVLFKAGVDTLVSTFRLDTTAVMDRTFMFNTP